MVIVKKLREPSNDDAVKLTRSEKMSMILMSYAATVLSDLREELSDRLETVENGSERMKELADKSDELLNEIRRTVPMNQRKQLQNTAMDFEMRLTPSTTNVVMQKEEFRELVDYARATCKDCTLDDTDCESCGLFQLLTVILPLEDYNGQFLCPYNLGKWGN